MMTDFPFDTPALAVSLGIVTLTFISEDAAAVSAALLVTGCAVLIWVTAIFSLTKLLGAAAFSWFDSTQSIAGSVMILAFSAAALAGMLLSSRRQFKRWAHWEFWPAWLFYLPVGAYYG